MFFIGMLIAAAIAAVVFWIIKKGIKLTWYEWALGGLAVLFTFMTFQHYTGSLNEYQETAATIGGLIFGGITLVLYIVTAQFIWRHNKS